ncbi:unnamed protein product, partial [Rotaria sp. Silwood2]
MLDESFLKPLLKRIDSQYRRHNRNVLFKCILKVFKTQLIYLTVLVIFQCHNQLYNAWKGPFPMNLNQFQNHLHGSYYIFSSLLFQPEFIQIEVGEDNIDLSDQNSLKVLHGYFSYGPLLSTYHPIEISTSYTREKALYVKLAADHRSCSQERYPYHFESFSFATLRCIVKQLAISTSEFSSHSDKSVYIKKIEGIYNRNPRVFNQQVITKCGILVGYLKKYESDFVFKSHSNTPYQFSDHVRIFDVSCYYTPYVSYLIICFFGYLLLVDLKILYPSILDFIHRPPLNLHIYIQEELKKVNSLCLADLNRGLLNADARNNYFNQIFIIKNKYLVMMQVNLNEKSAEILRQFYDKSPFIIIPIDYITNITSYSVVALYNNYYQHVHFMTSNESCNLTPAEWLHERVVNLNSRYRFNWHRQQLAEKRSERERQLESFIEEETLYQQRQYDNSIDQIMNGVVSASPNFIAQFRLDDPIIVTGNSRAEICSICLYCFKIGERVGEWPCDAKHTFHFK